MSGTMDYAKNVYSFKEFQGEVSVLHILVNVGYFYSDLLKIIRNSYFEILSDCTSWKVAVNIDYGCLV